MTPPKFDSVEAYLTSLDPVKAGTLRALMEFILAEFPELEAKMAWNVPHIHRNGKYVVGLAAYKRHLTFSPWSLAVMDAFRDRLGHYELFKNCFQIPVDWQIDAELVKDLVKARLAELDGGE